MGANYCYGVVEADTDAALGFTGVDGASPVRIVARDGLGCVVSEHRGDALGAASPNPNREDLLRALLSYQLVVERVMRDRTVLPVKFGTLLDGPDQARELLAQGAHQLHAALAAFQDKVELEVAATWDISRVLRQLSSQEQVVRAREAVATAAQPTVEARVRLGRLVKSCVDELRKGYADDIADRLKPLSAGLVPHALLSDAMVMNVAFLVERARRPRFEDVVREMDDLFRGELTFRVIGPLPPYSFGTVEVTRRSAEELEAARRALHVQDGASEDEVRRAYRRHAAQASRSADVGRNGGHDLPGLKHASELLVSHRKALSAVHGEDGHRNGATPHGVPFFSIAIQSSSEEDVEPARFGGLDPLERR